MTPRERTRVVRALRRAAEIATERPQPMADAIMRATPESSMTTIWAGCRRTLVGAFGQRVYYDAVRAAPLALLFVAAAVEAGDWP